MNDFFSEPSIYEIALLNSMLFILLLIVIFIVLTERNDDDGQGPPAPAVDPQSTKVFIRRFG
jgi:hypothetical protein